VLIVAGAAEPAEAAGAGRLVELLPAARLLRVRGATHDPWFEQPDEFFAAVRQFLQLE
jgi:pimeloyl-ACP methyl ester carboxylesterase